MRNLNTLTEQDMEDIGIDQRLGNLINTLILEIEDLRTQVSELQP
jgi:hypothetical protein